MRARRALVALLVVVAAGEASVRAGVQDTPLPTFSDGQAAQLAALIPGAIKDNNVETVVICTNLAPAPLDVGLEVFDETGALRNSIAAGDGAFLNVAPGVTVTVGTGPVAALHENQTLTLNTAGSGTNNLRNGSGRVVASGAPLGCIALAVDHLHTIEDPAVCATCQPPRLTTVPVLAGAISCGDVNGDHVANVGDALLIAQHDVGLRACGSLPFSHPEVCDVNRDGACNIGDALRIAQCDVGLISCAFTCSPFSCP